MNQFWIWFAILIVYCSTVSLVRGSGCEIDINNKSNTVNNLTNNCNRKELQSIFSNLTAGAFPPNGKLKGYATECGENPCDLIESFWKGKSINYEGGIPPNDHGTVTNNIAGGFTVFRATIYRTNAPIDGKEVFAIDYKNDVFVNSGIDYIRQLQTDLYLGIGTFRPFEKDPIVFFLLEKV